MRTPRNEAVTAAEIPVRPEHGRGTPAGCASESLDTNGAGARHSPERTCILSRRKGGRADLVRLALGPDGEVAPDVRARAPGRGAWIGVTRAELDAANAKGKLKAVLQRAFKTQGIAIPADLGAKTEAALRRYALDRLGMEARAGTLVTGSDRIDNAARSGKVAMLIHAADSGEDGRKKLDQSWRVGGGSAQGVIFPEGRTILSMALGRENVVHVALTDPAAAARVAHALARWRAFTTPACGPDGGEPASRPNATNELSTDDDVKE